MKLRQRLRRIGSRAWSHWLDEAYDQPRYQQRLSAVQEHLAHGLDTAPPGPLRVLGMCAGDGRDVIGVLRTHRRRTDVSARLVELDRQSVAAGVREVAARNLQDAVHFVHADATEFATYRRIAPAEIVLVCGVWGHVPAHERVSLVRALGALCKPGGTVIWTRGIAKGMDRWHEIEFLFSSPLWERVRISRTADEKWAVATHRYCGPPVELPGNGRIFSFRRRAGR